MKQPPSVQFYKSEEIADERLKYAVIMARYGGRWIFCRHKHRDTYEIPGGRREASENIDDTAKRELWEETGACRYSLEPICVYSVIWDDAPSYGGLYFAEVFELEPLPVESEIFELRYFDDLPEKMTYPAIQPILFEKVREWFGENR